MQSPPGELKRRIVPRWRSITRTPGAELENHRSQTPIDPSVFEEITRRIAEWSQDRNVDSAQELIWAASALGGHHDLTTALRQISSASDLPVHIRDSATELIKPIAEANVELTLHLDSRRVLQQHIRTLKDRIKVAPNNPIQYVELARLYSRLGQTDRAKKALKTACHLAPTARFVLRAATRFLVHIQEFELAIRVLSGGNPSDPWIQAARISLFDLSERPVHDMKRARAVLDTDVAPRHLSELAGSLATIEFGSGNVSKAKKLFKRGSIDPNDNMVAQLHWASQMKVVQFEPEMLRRSLTFEARASFARKEKDWTEALRHCADWLEDESFSIRPAMLGSYIAAEILQDFDRSIEFCEAGLVANPSDFTLLNNLAFSHAAKGTTDLATKFLDMAFAHMKTKVEEITYNATRGMIYFRHGQSDKGTAAYGRAIELAHEQKLLGLAQLAAVHYFSEVARLGSFFSTQDIAQISKLMEDKSIIEEVRNIYSVWLKPLLIDHAQTGTSDESIEPPMTEIIRY